MDSTLIIPKNTLADHIISGTVKNDIVNHITKIPNYQVLKFDIELTKYVLLLIENSIPPKTTKIDKVAVATDILFNVFSFSDQEKETVKSSINFLLDNGHIKAPALSKKTINSIGSWLKKKLL
jgi:hypothetical protein